MYHGNYPRTTSLQVVRDGYATARYSAVPLVHSFCGARTILFVRFHGDALGSLFISAHGLDIKKMS